MVHTGNQFTVKVTPVRTYVRTLGVTRTFKCGEGYLLCYNDIINLAGNFNMSIYM